MSPSFHIALRFLTAKKRAMLMSLACIVLGVGLFIVTQATTGGFEEFFIKTIMGTNGAIRIEDKIQDTMLSMEASGGSNFQIRQKEGRKFITGVENPEQLIEALRGFKNVKGASAVIAGRAMAQSGFKTDEVKLYGIDLQAHLAVSSLGSQLIAGNLASFRDNPLSALVGKALADRLQLDVGDSFVLSATGQSRHYKVAGIYETGVSDIDKDRMYLHLPEVRSLLKKVTGVTFIQVSLYDFNRAPQDARQIEEVLRHSASSWQVREKSWLEVFRALRISSGITVSVFTLIAGLAMFNTLAMIVMEKTKEVAILRSMGYTREDISTIFIWQAVIVLALGIVAGCGVGAGITYLVSVTPIRITGIFATNKFIVVWSGWHYLMASLTAIVMVMVASVVPARRAARMEPGDIIRGNSQ